MDNNSDWIIIGRFGRVQGLKGFIRIISFTDPQHNILKYAPWYGHINYQWQPITVLETQANNQHILALIEGYSGREEVGTLTNCDIAVKRETLPELTAGEYYWHDLEGMTVVTLTGATLGVVSEIVATGSNDVLIVTGEKRHLIPYLPDVYIISIDDKKRQITVDWDADF